LIAQICKQHTEKANQFSLYNLVSIRTLYIGDHSAKPCQLTML